MADTPAVVLLSDKQLVAYTAGDIDAFCACYHPDVTVLREDGSVDLSGIDDFRDRYGALFTAWQTRGRIDERLESDRRREGHWRLAQ